METSKLHKEASGLLATAAEQIGERVSSLLGTELKFSPRETVPLTAEGFATRVRKKAVALLLESAEDEGRAIVFFRISEAILLAATLLMVPAAQIKDMVRAGEMDKDTADAFTEIANIVYGAVDDVTVGRSSARGKLRNDGVQFVDAAKASDVASVWPGTKAFACEMTVSISGQEPGVVFLVIQDALAAHILGIPAEEEKEAGSDLPRPVVLLYGKDAALAQGILEYLEGKGYAANRADEAEEAIAMIDKAPRLVVAEFTQNPDTHVARVCRAAAEGEKTIPVVGVARNPTRETILGARKAGVRAFLVHPFTAEALQTKMDPFLLS